MKEKKKNQGKKKISPLEDNLKQSDMPRAMNNLLTLQEVLVYFTKVATDKEVLKHFDVKILNSNLSRAENSLKSLSAIMCGKVGED